MKVFALLVVAVAAVVCTVPAVHAAYCHGKPSPDAQPNMLPIYTGAPTLVRTATNAKLFTVGEGDDKMNILHLWGTPYQRGHAQGTILKDNCTTMINEVWEYFEEQVVQAIDGSVPWIPKEVALDIANVGLAAALDATWELTKNFTNPDFFQEIQGMADASGQDYLKIRRIHMIGELTKGSCSMMGAWGSATKSTGGNLLQLRALDWNTDGPFQKYPQVTVYHSVSEANAGGNSFANVGWTGWLGLITGMSVQGLAASEIGVSFPDASFGKESRVGIPFTNILKDILHFDSTLAEAKHRIATANRTCDLILAVGDGKSAEFTGVQYSHSVANFYNDTNQLPVGDWHPSFPNVTYNAMDWLCANYDSVMGKQIAMLHGNITAENTIRHITPIVQTGSLHVAVFDLAHLKMWVANARTKTESGPLDAYDRQFNYLDMSRLFFEPPPHPSPPSLDLVGDLAEDMVVVVEDLI